MSRTTVTFNGTVLTDLCIVSNLKTSLLPRSINTADVAGRDGSLFTGATLQPKSITMTLTIRGATPEERQEAALTLASVLNVDEPKPLNISIDGDLYYLAIPNAESEGARYINADSYEVTFVAPDPVKYGTEQTVTVPSGGSVTFDVGGTYPTYPTITASSARKGSSGYWKLTLEDGSYLIATCDSTSSVVADCAERTLTVAGDNVMLQPEADWLVFEPGEHTLTMNGTGAATVTYVERWL